MATSTLGAADRFGFDRAKFFDCRNDLQDAIASLRNQINASTARDPLSILALGPMEVLWRAVSASASAKRQHVTVISHTSWNATKTFPPRMTHTRADVEALGVEWIQIKSQKGLYTRNADGSSKWSPWFWLRDAAKPRLRWIYDRMRTTGKADASDAGVAYYFLTNDQNATPFKLRNLLIR